YKSQGINYNDIKKMIDNHIDSLYSIEEYEKFLTYYSLMNISKLKIQNKYKSEEFKNQKIDCIFKLIIEDYNFMVKYISNEKIEKKKFNWCSVVQCLSDNKILFATNVKPNRKEAWNANDYDNPDIGQIKNSLEKSIKLCYAGKNC